MDCEHKLKQAKPGFVFCSECGERWLKEPFQAATLFAPAPSPSAWPKILYGHSDVVVGDDGIYRFGGSITGNS